MNTKTLLLLLVVAMIYLTWLLLHQVIFHRSFCRPANRVAEYFYHRLSGFLFLGIISYWIGSHWLDLSPAQMGVGFTLNNVAKWSLLAAVLVIPALMFRVGPQKRNLWDNPKIRARHWSWALVLFSTLSWIIYLFAYEFFFRGFLLFPCIDQWGLVWAVVINVVFYSLAHLDQGWRMVIGAAIFSVILSLISFYTGNFYAAFLIHVINACCNEWISLYYHPEMRVKGLI